MSDLNWSTATRTCNLLNFFDIHIQVAWPPLKGPSATFGIVIIFLLSVLFVEGHGGYRGSIDGKGGACSFCLGPSRVLRNALIYWDYFGNARANLTFVLVSVPICLSLGPVLPCRPKFRILPWVVVLVLAH